MTDMRIGDASRGSFQTGALACIAEGRVSAGGGCRPGETGAHHQRAPPAGAAGAMRRMRAWSTTSRRLLASMASACAAVSMCFL